jgi:hypothetical protein
LGTICKGLELEFYAFFFCPIFVMDHVKFKHSNEMKVQGRIVICIDDG